VDLVTLVKTEEMANQREATTTQVVVVVDLQALAEMQVVRLVELAAEGLLLIHLLLVPLHHLAKTSEVHIFTLAAVVVVLR
jgi:hypothetical protein